MEDEEDWVEVLGKLAIASGVAILGGLILKALFNRNTRVYRCPTCGLVVRKQTVRCPRCGTFIDWRDI